MWQVCCCVGIDVNVEVDKDVEVDVCVEMSIIGCTVRCPLTTCAADMKTPHWTTTPLIIDTTDLYELYHIFIYFQYIYISYL